MSDDGIESRNGVTSGENAYQPRKDDEEPTEGRRGHLEPRGVICFLHRTTDGTLPCF